MINGKDRKGRRIRERDSDDQGLNFHIYSSSSLTSDYLNDAPSAYAAVVGSYGLKCFAPFAKSPEFVHSAGEILEC
jgi:hypothetical protein